MAAPSEAPTLTVIECDFDHIDGEGRLRLSDLAAHAETPFGQIASSGGKVLFVDGGESVEGGIVEVGGPR